MRVPRSSAWLGIAGLLSALSSVGCVERWLHVRPDPPGPAAVYVDGAYAGTTAGDEPLVVPFETYGARVVTVRRPGFVPARREVALDPPWYQYPPIDLFSDLLWPGTIEDVREVRIRLEPRPEPADAEEVLREAEHYRETMERRP